MEQIGLGTELKINVHIEPIGDLHMSDYDFSVRFYTKSGSPTISTTKNEMVEVDTDNYIALVDTSGMTAGVVQMVVKALIPDADSADLYRTEVTPPIITDIMLVSDGLSERKHTR
jgi:hypothetical protein